MNDNDLSSQKKEDKTTKKKGQRGLFRLPLTKAMELAKGILDLGDDMPVPKAMALGHINRSSKGGATQTLVAASNVYGLTRLVDEKFQLTDTGRQLVTPGISEADKRRVAHDILFSNETFSTLVTRYGDKALPNDKAVHLFLTQNYGLTDSDAKTMWTVTKQNMNDFGLIIDLPNGEKMIVARERAEKSLGNPSNNIVDVVGQDETSVDVDNNLPPSDQPSSKQGVNLPIQMTSNSIKPEFHFNIQIHLPSDAQPEQYNAIFKSIGIYLLGHNNKDEN